ncbi:MAG: sugar nucleotide-binding protein [Verrucomicrobiota bacterium]
MTAERIAYDRYLICSHPAKKWVRDRIVELLNSESVVPSFSNVAIKLNTMVRDEHLTIEELGQVIALDPGLASRCVRVAGSVAYRGRNISTINEALLLIGMTEVRRIAMTVGVMDTLSHLCIKIDWKRFWLHSVMVARLTEKIAGAFRDVTGMEYLAGLLHDVGKLILEHYFPREFETVLLRSMERKCGHAEAEMDLLGLDHTQIGAAMCECLKTHPHILQAVRFHHDALHPAHTGNPDGDGGFLAACISVADVLTNLGDINIGGEKLLLHPFAELPEWKYLNQWFNCRGLELDLRKEIEAAEAEVQLLAEGWILRRLENPSRIAKPSFVDNQPIVWITGAAGLIGNYFVQTAPQFAPSWRVIGLTRAELDLLDFAAVRRRFHSDAPQLVIHCAALSQSPACQKNPDLARRLNVDVTRELAQIAAAIPFIFLSTDLVFDGQRGNYDETAPVNPLSVYAETKVAAEKFVLANPRHTVVRTSLNGGTSPTGDRGFNEQLRRAFAEGQTLNLFTDEFRNPIPAAVTARAIWELAAKKSTGLFHLAGAEKLSRWDMGGLIAARWPQLKPKLVATSLRTYQGAPRSPDTSLNCGKVQRLLSFPLPGLRGWLAKHPGEAF